MTSLRIRAAALAGALAAILLSPPSARADDGPAGLLAKHQAFVGWQLGDGTMNTLRTEVTYTDPSGKKTDKLVTVRSGLAYRTTDTDLKNGVPRDNGFTGNIFWSTNQNGFTTPVFGDAAKTELAEDVIFSEGTTRMSPADKGSGTVDGKAVRIVRVSAASGYPIDLYVDPDTGAYLQATIDPDGSNTEVLHIDGYTSAAPGKKVIGSYHYNNSKGRFTADSATGGVPVADADLHPPAPTATWAFNNAQPFPVKVTDTRFILDAKVNGAPGRFILDTGADGIYLTKKFAHRAGAKPFTTANIGGIGDYGPAHAEVDHVDTIEVGGNVLSNVIVQALDDELDPDAPDGAIGFDLLGGAIVTLDTQAQTMSIADPGTAVDASKGVTLNVDLTSGQPVVPMKVNNKIDVNATLDSGDYYYVLFGKELITHYGLVMLVDDSLLGTLQSHPVTGGAGGLEVESCGHLDSLVLGPIVYGNPPACQSGSFSGRDILVGFDFLRHFDYIFDYPHGHIVMTPHKE